MQDEAQNSEPSRDIPEPLPLSQISNSNQSDRLKMFTIPLSQRGWPIWLIYLAAALGLIYILNPTLGFFEFIPDNLPLIGNLDEGVAFVLVWFGIVEYLQRKQSPK